MEIPIEKRFFDKIDKTTTCWIWKAHTYVSGYGAIFFNGKITGAHRVSWIIHKGNIPNDMLILHRCDNKLCVNPEHLFIGTTQDNIKDKMEKGRQPKGESHWKSILSEKDVINIRNIYECGKINQTDISKKYGVTRKAISMIITRKNWKHI